MPGPLKRTKLKSSPEEAEFYRRFHDRGVAALRQGISRDALLKELQEHGASLLSAERLVTAFEQEASLKGKADQHKGDRNPVVFIVALVLGLGSAGYLAWTLGHDGQFRWGYVGGAILLVVIPILLAVSRR
jgi:hypothetical protein